MKLLLVAQEPKTPNVGVAQVLSLLGAELERRGHTVHYFFAEDSRSVYFPAIAPLEWPIHATPRLVRQCRREDYDIIFTTGFSGWCLSTFKRWLLPPRQKSSRFAPGKRVQIVSWQHGWEELKWQQQQLEEAAGFLPRSTPVQHLYQAILLWMSRQLLITQDACFCTSTEERDWIQQTYPTEAAKVIYLPNGVSHCIITPSAFPASRWRILIVCYLWVFGTRGAKGDGF